MHGIPEIAGGGEDGALPEDCRLGGRGGPERFQPLRPARGRTELALEVLDEYSASDCAYRRTIRLPQKAVAMAASEGVFYFAMMEPAPTILAARPKRR